MPIAAAALVLLVASGCDSQPKLAGPESSPRATVAASRQDTLAPLLEMDNPRRIQGRYIVRFVADLNDARGASEEIAVRHRGKVYRALPSLKGFWGELPDAAVQALRADPRVRYIEADVAIPLQGVGDTTQNNAPGPLDRMDQRALPLNSTYEWSVVGTGVHIWIVDNGVDMYDAELTGRVNTSHFSTHNGQNAFASCSTDPHGTTMARAAAGSTSGVARNATIHSARVNEVSNCRSLSSGATSAAMEYITDYSPRPAVINYSASQDCWWEFCGNTVDDAAEYAYDNGVTVVVAAGNGGADEVADDACGFSPAHVGRIITVAASDAGTDARLSYSNYGSCVDLFAPVLFSGGTSTATAYVSGTAALQLQLYPNIPPSMVFTKIKDNTTLNALSNIGSGSPNRLLYTRQGTLSLGINGYHTLGPSTPCTWNALPMGGQPPYTFEWKRDGVFVSALDSYSVGAGGSSTFGLGLQVWDGVGRTISTGKTIFIDPFNNDSYCGQSDI